ncbi:MAG: phage terminase large subunit [Alphaproteobacteria bacterium]|nr:phage terminase large subunit [Alphaproteobacteria bacterium]
MQAWRTLAKNDLFFLLVYVLGVWFANNQWVLDRCREFQDDPYGHLDLWARGHFKSTIITYAHTIFLIINNPEITIGIFSHKLPIAKGFVRQIKNTFESNDLLKGLFPDIFYEKPETQSIKWTEDKICVNRTTTRKEMTVEACGVVEGQPTGMHFDVLIYDDLVTLESVSTPEQILKTTAAFRMSLNLGSKGAQRIMIGTFYAYNDTYNELIKEGSVEPRIYPAMTDPADFETSVFLPPEELATKRIEMGAATFGTQMLLDPSVANNRYFAPEWLKYYDGKGWETMNRYIVVDPASSNNKKSDYTVMIVLGFGRDGNYYLIDGVRDRLNLSERTNWLFKLVEEYKPNAVWYESYGQQADSEHISAEMDLRHYRFNICKLGGQMAKKQRIERLQPLFEQGKIFFPTRLPMLTVDGEQKDFVQMLIDDEYMKYPAVNHDDMIDALARLFDINGVFPNQTQQYQTFFYNKK